MIPAATDRRESWTARSMLSLVPFSKNSSFRCCEVLERRGASVLAIGVSLSNVSGSCSRALNSVSHFLYPVESMVLCLVISAIFAPRQSGLRPVSPGRSCRQWRSIWRTSIVVICREIPDRKPMPQLWVWLASPGWLGYRRIRVVPFSPGVQGCPMSWFPKVCIVECRRTIDTSVSEVRLRSPECHSKSSF